MNKVPLIYILSSGRSGTTLLDMLLGAHPNTWTTGEIQLLPHELADPRSPCGCGNPVRRCAFWSNVIENTKVDRSGAHVGYFRNKRQVGKVLRWAKLLDLLRGSVSERWSPIATEYEDRNVQLFRSVKEEARTRTDQSIRWLVDASKDPYRLLWLQQSNRFDIRVIHLIKDPRSFVYSMVRPQLPGGGRKTIRMTGRWIIENALMSRLCRTAFLPSHVKQIAYEQLARSPKKTLEVLAKWLNLNPRPELVNSFREYENHAVSGNAMRWRDSEEEIRLDERWRQKLPVERSRFIRVFTAPFLGYCGYEDYFS